MSRRQTTARAACATLVLSFAASCARAPEARAPHAAYAPRSREITVTTVPLLVKEDVKRFPFLARDFAPGGVLDGKEVYAFVPNDIVAYAGDTLQLTFVNPEDDKHSFVLPDLFVRIPGQSTVHAMYVARHPGIVRFSCSIPSHLPMMTGELVVLPDRDAADSAAPHS